MDIRQIDIDDAHQFLVLNKKLDAETPFLLKYPGERKTTLQNQRTIIKHFENNGTIVFVATHKSRLIGFIGGHHSSLRKTKHCLHIAIGILQEFTNLGLGKRLFVKLENWASKNDIHRLELNVNIQNYGAISLYEKIGFEKEGIKKHALRVKNKFVDEYYMSKLIE